ncbi:hypothetical protein DH2020_015792 [Rehmannia glutinosa]|uniref:E3 ubiquitin-protein ligase CHFR cysteine rich domain-containing protein n=1 Tax=Rehmannia glutinosa TaxID=99300 RepID=A0ABR0WUH5_REHGL
MERGESSGSTPAGDDIWAKLVPLDSGYSDIELRSNEVTICSEIKSSLSEKQEWCKITREKDQCSALMQNKSSTSIIVDGTVVHEDDMTIIRCGSEIILGPEADGFMRYMFKVMPAEEICKKQLKDILQSDSSLRRPSDEIAVLDSCSSIKSPLVLGSGRKLRRKRPRAPPDEENDRDFPCPQCGTEYAGFQCNGSTVHLQCQSCGGMMPSRSNATVPQHCLGCDRAFCGAYWHALGVAGSDVYSLCSHETLKPVLQSIDDNHFCHFTFFNISSSSVHVHLIADRSVPRIPFLAHEKNRHEQDITEKCIRQMGSSLQDVISEWIRKMGNREVDRTRLPLNHPDMITPQTYVCNDCYDKLVSFLLYWFRITLPKHFLPPEALNGKTAGTVTLCRTQHHNEEHALLQRNSTGCGV